MRFLLPIVVVAGAWIFVIAEQWEAVPGLFPVEDWSYAKEFVSGLAGAGDDQPAFLDADRWRAALGMTYETLLMSVLAIALAGGWALFTAIPAARNMIDGTVTATQTRPARALFILLRWLNLFSRSVPELIWAMLIVFIFSPGLWPGAVALGIHNAGILGKLCAESVEAIAPGPARAVRTCGAGRLQTLFYAVLPTVLPQFVTYMLYRWEVVIRTTVVVGFVSAGGLGREFRLAMSWFHYTDLTLLLMCYVGLVLSVDLASGLMRRLVR